MDNYCFDKQIILLYVKMIFNTKRVTLFVKSPLLSFLCGLSHLVQDNVLKDFFFSIIISDLKVVPLLHIKIEEVRFAVTRSENSSKIWQGCIAITR